MYTAVECEDLPPYLRHKGVQVGAFPAMMDVSYQVFFENDKKQSRTTSSGMKPALFQAMMNVLPSVFLEYPKNDGTSLKFQSFVSKCSAMADLNYTLLELGDRVPHTNVLICKNKSFLTHVL